MDTLNTNFLTAPRFKENQRVKFVGGMGIIKTCRSEANCWTYFVEMDMGPIPDMGRIGYETTVVLSEDDIVSIKDDCYSCLAVA